MEPSGIGTTSSAQFKLATAFPHAANIERSAAPAPGLPESELRRNVGEFVGNAFYGTLLREMQDSKIKGKYFHGGRGEEIFQSQLNMEMSKRMGQASNDPIANKMYDAFARRLGSRQPARKTGESLA
ncbi:MAG: hypothetical protein ACE5EQ_07940 [Phycisphaerae bacterium]